MKTRSWAEFTPMDELKAEGVDTDEMLANPTYSEGVGVVTQRLLERADWLYKRADHGIAQLPRKYQPAFVRRESFTPPLVRK